MADKLLKSSFRKNFAKIIFLYIILSFISQKLLSSLRKKDKNIKENLGSVFSVFYHMVNFDLKV